MQTTIFKMNVQTEKLKLIEWLIGLQDLTVLKQLEKLRNQSEIEAYEANLKPMTREELVARAEASMRDIEAGRVYDIDVVMKEDYGL